MCEAEEKEEQITVSNSLLEKGYTFLEEEAFLENSLSLVDAPLDEKELDEDLTLK